MYVLLPYITIYISTAGTLFVTVKNSEIYALCIGILDYRRCKKNEDQYVYLDSS